MKKKIIDNIISLGIALLLVLIIRSSIIEAYKIPSGSMIPTLLVGDHIFVNKFSYGFKVPILEWFMDNPVYIYKRNPPERGDIIVFKYPKDESLYYIKRVIGLPGDTINLKDKQLFINGKAIDRTALKPEESKKYLELMDTEKYNPSNLEIFSEKLSSNDQTTEHLMMIDDGNFGSYAANASGPWKVPAEMYFVMGDNRDHSNDSRFWGFVPEKNIKGRAFVIWFSIWLDFANWSESVFRPTRMGILLH